MDNRAHAVMMGRLLGRFPNWNQLTIGKVEVTLTSHATAQHGSKAHDTLSSFQPDSPAHPKTSHG